MEPTTVTCAGACTVTHVITIDAPPFNLSEADGALIAGAILAVWAIGWAYRVLVKTLKHTDGYSISEE